MSKSILKVEALPSSFVVEAAKLFADVGSGEAKLHVGSSRKQREFDDFFEFGKNYIYSFDKDNLLLYLQQVKLEYAYQTINKYKSVTIEYWDSHYSEIRSANDEYFRVVLTKFVDISRYYVRAEEDVFKKTLRSIALPKITNVIFTKSETESKIRITLELNLQYNSQNTGRLHSDENEADLMSEFQRNRILFGAPGTGKSFTLNMDKDQLLQFGGEYERVTFHPDYSYANFVGTYKPVPAKDQDDKDSITYKFVAGPFMRTYVKALKSLRTSKALPYLLIIEEINRANIAAVFGDVFQLLDRDARFESEYPVQASEDIRTFLYNELHTDGDTEDYSSIKLPSNLFIWATMNSADQGVFPMDTAFKRRWSFDYLGIDNGEEEIRDISVILGQGEFRRRVDWNELRKSINDVLSTYRINEDKLLGPFFISREALMNSDRSGIDNDRFIKIFKNKVLMYLFEDAARQKRSSLFDGCKDSTKFSSICDDFELRGLEIFCREIKDRFLKLKLDTDEMRMASE